MSNLDFHTQNYIQGGVSVNQSLAEQERAKYKDNLFFLIVSFIALSLMLVIIVLNTYVFFIADVSGTSMYPTLKDDDKLIANKYKEPQVNCIVTIRMGNELWIKRVIAVGGDRVEIKNGFVYVNGKVKDEPYLVKQGETYIKDSVGYDLKDKTLDYTLKEDEIFYLGDNRAWSSDAREHGPCKKEDVVGVIENWSLRLIGVRE